MKRDSDGQANDRVTLYDYRSNRYKTRHAKCSLFSFSFCPADSCYVKDQLFADGALHCCATVIFCKVSLMLPRCPMQLKNMIYIY